MGFIKDAWKDFYEPVCQRFRNIGDSIIYGIPDAIADRRDYGKPQKKGCLWKIIKWIFILAVLSALLSECGSESKGSVDNGMQITKETMALGQNTPAQETQKASESASIQSTNDLIVAKIRNNIDAILAESPIDMDALQSEYEALLGLKMCEYMFKASTYFHFSSSYDGNYLDDIFTHTQPICEEMKQYLSEEEVDQYYSSVYWSAYSGLDDSHVDYDALLVGSEEKPDVDAMWNKYLDSQNLLEDIDTWDRTNRHSTEAHANLTPADSTEAAEPEATFSQRTDVAEKECLEGYVVYGIGELNVRNGPGVSYEQVGRLPEGKQVTIWETQYSGTAEWGRIDSGWVCMDYIKIGTLIQDPSQNVETGETYETSYFSVTLPESWGQKYILEQGESNRGEHLVFYNKAEYAYYQYTYPEMGGWAFAIEVRCDGDGASMSANWEPIGLITSSDGYSLNLFIQYGIDAQFTDEDYDEYFDDAHKIVTFISAKEGHEITLFN